jgi:hypothetical protein
MTNERREGHPGRMAQANETSEERKARNEALFRDANEAVRSVQKDLAIPEGLMPFICECEEAGCRTIVRITQAQYEGVRADPRRFLIAPGHEGTQERVVAANEAYCVVEKEGPSARIAEETDPRKEG